MRRKTEQNQSENRLHRRCREPTRTNPIINWHDYWALQTCLVVHKTEQDKSENKLHRRCRVPTRINPIINWHEYWTLLTPTLILSSRIPTCILYSLQCAAELNVLYDRQKCVQDTCLGCRKTCGSAHIYGCNALRVPTGLVKHVFAVSNAQMLRQRSRIHGVAPDTCI